jgi:hemerythrin-like metal-binding protein
MKKFVWSRKYEIHVPELDAGHQAIFELTGALAEAAAEGATRRIPALAAKIRSGMAAHFAREEELMRESVCPSLAWHRRQHQSARARAQAPALRRGDRQAARELADYLAGWLDSHIRITDRMMAAHLQNHSWRRTAAKAS